MHPALQQRPLLHSSLPPMPHLQKRDLPTLLPPLFETAISPDAVQAMPLVIFRRRKRTRGIMAWTIHQQETQHFQQGRRQVEISISQGILHTGVNLRYMGQTLSIESKCMLLPSSVLFSHSTHSRRSCCGRSCIQYLSSKSLRLLQVHLSARQQLKSFSSRMLRTRSTLQN